MNKGFHVHHEQNIPLFIFHFLPSQMLDDFLRLEVDLLFVTSLVGNSLVVAVKQGYTIIVKWDFDLEDRCCIHTQHCRIR